LLASPKNLDEILPCVKQFDEYGTAKEKYFTYPVMMMSI
jgi:hypothetical protein